MRLLVLGGGGFLGHHAVAEAVAAGHEVTTFNREGRSALPGVEPLQGDRGGDLAPLRGREWDAVLDTFSDPAAVGASAALLSGRTGAYGYVSGISVYHPDGPDVVDEDAPLRRPGQAPPDDPLQERSLAKLACEEAVHGCYAGPVLIARPGIMVGPRDPTDRFTYWPVRLAGAGVVVAPGDPERPVQYTDARDLALWLVRMLAAREGGTFNAVGPGRPEPLRAVLEACRAAGGGRTELRWVAEDRVAAAVADVEEEARPLWFPEPQIPFAAVDTARARAAGLTFRATEETARDTLAWARAEPREGGLRAGLPPGVEAALLE